MSGPARVFLGARGATFGFISANVSVSVSVSVTVSVSDRAGEGQTYVEAWWGRAYIDLPPHG